MLFVCQPTMDVCFQMKLTSIKPPSLVSLSSLKNSNLDDEAKQMVTEAANARGVALEM